MKKLSFDRNSILSSALWFGASAAIQAVLIVGFWSVIVPSTAYVPALIWGFVSGAIVGVLIWNISITHTPTLQSYRLFVEEMETAEVCSIPVFYRYI